ncbi:MAG TPA: tRNA 4-thiouridine(8) synthase ThiI, partial [Spirochaetia bacterium]|nr:tRNA 4-thiouridine(8) synthase ThiI [Spirochaetia bacterium]
MQTLFFIKYGEIALKGRNRAFFLHKLKSNILDQLRGLPADVTLKRGRLLLRVKDEDADAAGERLGRVIGIARYSKAVQTEKDVEEIKKAALKLAEAV